MKKTIILRSVCLGFLAVLALFGAGCGRKSPYEGRWVDVNGSTTLEFRRNTVTVRFGSRSEKYRFKVTETSYGTTILSADPEGSFGGMSELEAREDGSLCAAEMVLDAEGHSYRFVRPEALAAEKEIRDLSEDAPKEIASTELESFSFVFRNRHGSYGLDERWPSGSYSWELERQEDGGYRMDFRVMGDSYIALDFSDTVSGDYAEGLARLLSDLGVPAFNGYYRTNSVSKPGYSLWVTYASGERLSVRASGDAGDECVFDLPALLEYAARQELFPEK